MDPNYQFYLHIEDLKNSLYRQLSGARQASLFWPKFYYSWFYGDEKTLYNMLNLRQKLGREITENEITSYNKIREQIVPKSPYVIAKRKVEIADRNNLLGSLVYSDITWKRKPSLHHVMTPFALIALTRYLKLPNWWIAASFLPNIILYFSDRNFVPYSELENFYKYLYERRKAETFYKISNEEVQNQLSQLNSEELNQLKSEMKRTNRTLYEVVQSVDEMLLNAAINSAKTA